jgi:hypothetical protein
MQGLTQAADQVEVSWIREPYGLIAENSLIESVVEEGILHIKLLNGSVTGDSSSEHRVNGGRFHNWTESLIVVDPGALSETLEDSASLVAIKGPIDTKLVHKNPLVSDDVGATGLGDKFSGPIAHQGPIRILHSHAPIGIGKHSMDRG